MLFSAADYLSDYYDDGLVISERQAADWLNDKEGIIFSDRAPIYTWYLQKEVGYVKHATDGNTTNQELVDNNVTYYVAMTYKYNFTDYSTVKEFGDVVIYQKN